MLPDTGRLHPHSSVVAPGWRSQQYLGVRPQPDSMETIALGPWTLRVDADATRRAYADVAAAGPDECACSECRNFVAARTDVYPVEALALFERLGASPLREAEVMHLGSAGEGRVRCVGWVHAVGTVEGRYGDGPGHQLAPGFEVWARAAQDMAPPPLRNLALVQLEFATEIPWLLDEPPPDQGVSSRPEA